MSDFGFIGQPGVPAPPQPGVASPLGGQQQQVFQQQQAAALAQALQSMQQSGEQSKTPAALGSNLLADALMQYGQGQQGQAQAAQAYGASPGAYGGPDPLANPLGPQQSQAPPSGRLSPFMQLGGAGQ